MSDAPTNGNGSSKLWAVVAAGIAAWTFLISPYVDRTEDMKVAIMETSRITKELVEMRYADNRRDIDKLDERLSRLIEDEQKRNNSIESRLAAVEKVNTLFEHGKLKLNGGHQ